MSEQGRTDEVWVEVRCHDGVIHTRVGDEAVAVMNLLRTLRPGGPESAECKHSLPDLGRFEIDVCHACGEHVPPPEETATCACCGEWLDGAQPPYCRDCHAKGCP